MLRLTSPSRVAPACHTRTTDYIAWLDTARNAGATHPQIRAGDAVTLSADTHLNVLSPPLDLYPPGEGDTSASNDLILRR